MIEHAVEVSPPVRRRRWSDAIKARIVAESFAPGTVVWEVSRRHDLSPQHLSAWRKAARSGLLKLPNGTSRRRRGPPARARLRISARQAARLLGCSVAQAQGMSSSRREAGQRLTSLVRTSVR
jgi:transposase-like protein